MLTETLDRWSIVQARDGRYDGQFYYGVTSTHIFCRPSCPSRRPTRERVAFFDDAAAAAAAGFRPCRRCHPLDDAIPQPHRDLIAEICRELTEATTIPSLAELGARYAMSPYHLQRIFTRAVGISPHQFAARQRRERAREQLRAGADVTTAIFDAGYQTSSTFYAHDAAALGMAPAHFRRGGEGVQVRYATAPSALGLLLVAATERGVCFVALGDDAADLLRGLRTDYPAAITADQDVALSSHVQVMLDYLAGHIPHPDLPLDVRATAFQEQVWQFLRRIPPGTTLAYHEVAAELGQPSATRAVAHACATNPVSLVIPCHRVRRTDGTLGGYRWGLGRKATLIAAERLAAGSEERQITP